MSRNNRKLRCYKRDNRVRKFLDSMPTPACVTEGDSETSYYWFSEDRARYANFIRYPKSKADVLVLADRSLSHVEANSLGRRFNVAAVVSFIREFLKESQP